MRCPVLMCIASPPVIEGLDNPAFTKVVTAKLQDSIKLFGIYSKHTMPRIG
jgi:hypothetical protein